MNKGVIYIAMAFLLIVVGILLIVAYLFKDNFLSIKKIAHLKRKMKMSQIEKRRFYLISILAIISIFIALRAYNNRAEVKVTAEDASYYGIVEAKIPTNLKLEDLDILYEDLEENYPFFNVNKRLQGKNWLDNKKKHKKLIKNTKNDAEFFVAMERILDDLNDSNLQILSGDDFEWNYKNTYEHLVKSDNVNNFAIYGALRNRHVMYRYLFEGIENTKLYSVDNLETKVLKDNEIAYMKIKAMAGFEELESDYNKMKIFLKDVEEYDKLIIDIRGNGGGEDDYWKGLVELLTDKPLEAKYYSFFKGGHRFDRDAYKVEGVTTIKQLDDEILKGFPEEIKTDFSFYKINDIKINPLDGINFKSKIYLLVDGDVNSQAENFASFAKDTSFATLVGETTGGNKVFEDIPIIYLRNSKFAVSYSRELGINADGTINMETKTTPNIEVDSTMDEDFNKDKSIQAVIND